MSGNNGIDVIMDWWLTLWLISVLCSLLLFMLGALRGWLTFLWLVVGFGIYPPLLAHLRLFQSPHVQFAFWVVVGVGMFITSLHSDDAISAPALYVVVSLLCVYVRGCRLLFLSTFALVFAFLVLCIVASHAKMVVKIVRVRLQQPSPSSSSYVDNASAAAGSVQQPLPSSSSYVDVDDDDASAGPLQQPPQSSYYYVDDTSASASELPPSSSSSVGDNASVGPLQQSLPSSSSHFDRITVEMGEFNYMYNQQQQEECVICLCEYREEDALVALPPCQHNFHVDCIRRWLNCHLRCPICNACPLQKLGSQAEKDVALHLPPLLAAGNMPEENRGNEGNV